MSKKRLNSPVLPAQKENFQKLFNCMVKEGYDFDLQEKQTEFRIWFNEEGFSLIIGLNGRWRIE